MRLKVHIVDNPAIAEPDSGAYVQVIAETVAYKSLEVEHYTLHLRTKIGGVMMPDEESIPLLTDKQALERLRCWSEEGIAERHVFMTRQSATVLLPQMACPFVPFALDAPDKWLKERCITVLGYSLNFAD